MKRPDCTVCGSTEGPAIYAGDPQCCVNCKKFADGTYTEASYVIFSGRVFNQETGFYDLNLQKEHDKKVKGVKKPRRGMTNTIL